MSSSRINRTSPPPSLDDLQGLRSARWVRESTNEQFDRYGPDSQRQQMDRFAERYGLADTGLGWEVPESGRTVWRHPKMTEMIAAARAGAFDVLLTGYADRWQRNLRRFLELIEDALHASGVALVMCDRRLLSSDPHDWDEIRRCADCATSPAYGPLARRPNGLRCFARSTRESRSLAPPSWPPI